MSCEASLQIAFEKPMNESLSSLCPLLQFIWSGWLAVASRSRRDQSNHASVDETEETKDGISESTLEMNNRNVF